MILSGNIYPWKIFTAEIINQIGLEMSARWSCSLRDQLTGEWGGGMGDMDGDIGYRRRGDSPELRVWKKRKRIRSDDRQTDGQMDKCTVSTCEGSIKKTIRCPLFVILSHSIQEMLFVNGLLDTINISIYVSKQKPINIFNVLWYHSERNYL